MVMDLLTVLVLSIIFRWANELLHVKGMFSCGKYQHENPIYMNVQRSLSKTTHEMCCYFCGEGFMD